MAEDMLKELEQEFGVNTDKIDTHSITFQNRKYTLRRMGWEDVKKSNRLITQLLREESLNATDAQAAVPQIDESMPVILELTTELAIVSVALAAIDDIPVWKIFKVASDEDVTKLACNPLEPPPHIRHAAADKMANLFNKGKKVALVRRLFAEYENVLDEPVNPVVDQVKGQATPEEKRP